MSAVQLATMESICVYQDLEERMCKDVAGIILQYADTENSFQLSHSVDQKRTLLQEITMLFLTIVTFGIWNLVQTNRFCSALEQSLKLIRNSERIENFIKLEKALLWGADISQTARYDLNCFNTDHAKPVLYFLAAQINPELGEVDPILQQFCYTITHNFLGQDKIRYKLNNQNEDHYKFFLELLNSHLETVKANDPNYEYIRLKNKLQRDSSSFDYAVDAFNMRMSYKPVTPIKSNT